MEKRSWISSAHVQLCIGTNVGWASRRGTPRGIRTRVEDAISAQRRDVLLVGPPGLGKSHLVQAIGREVLKAGFLVLYRSIFDLVRELLSQDTQSGEGSS